VRVGVLATPVFQVTQVGFEIRLQAVQHVGFIERARQATFAARAVIGGHEDQSVVELTDTLELGNDTTYLQVDPFHLCSEHFHLPCIKPPLLGRQRVPCRDFINALGQFGIGRDNAQFLLSRDNFFAGFVPAHVKFALVFIDNTVGRMVR